jgi:hypothetical protein
LTNAAVSELTRDQIAAASQNNYPSSIKITKLLARYAVLFGVVIILVIFGIVYIRRNITRPNNLLNPTATPRIQWLELTGPPIPRRGLAVANFENQIYVIGGENTEGISNIVESYDPQTNLWTTLAPKPTSVTDINAAVIGGLIYIPGGRLSTGIPTNITEVYDPRSNQWSSASPMPRPLSAYALTVFEGRIYLFGGWDGKQVVNNAYVYDSHSNSWSEIPLMTTARAYAGAAVVGGKIYVIGGWDGQNALSVNEIYLPDNSREGSPWIKAPALPSGRYGMGITNLADIIFIIGGIGPDENLTTIALSSGDADWGQIQAPLQKGWSFLGAVTIGTRLYALGGRTDAGMINQMWSYQAIFTITLPIIR